MKEYTLAALALCFSVSSANAITIVGVAKSSCGSWTQEKQRDSVKYWQMEA